MASTSAVGIDPREALRTRLSGARMSPRTLWLIAGGAVALGAVLSFLVLNLGPAGAIVLSGPLVIAATWVGSRYLEDRRRATERLMTMLVTFAFLLALVPLVSVMWQVIVHGLARFDVALAAIENAPRDPNDLWFAPLLMVELIEAATRCGKKDRAAVALRMLSETTQASGTPWARGIEARSRALLADGAAADILYREAIEHLRPTRLRVDLARTHLLHGGLLSREGRRVDARKALRTAHELFSQFGMEAFAERARVELADTGKRARKQTVDTLGLTPQEAQIARLVAGGDTNREIAAQLFISPSTVDYHLRKVFRKLGVKSRMQLVRRLP